MGRLAAIAMLNSVFRRMARLQARVQRLLERTAPNPSIERTSQRPLRALWPAAHVER